MTEPGETNHDIERRPAQKPQGPARKPEVDPDRFFALDIRVGKIVDVEPFEEARASAWKLTVDFGPEVGTLRTSAQVTNYLRDALLGRRVVGVINIGTKRIAGFTSQFLVLGAIEPNGMVRLLEVEEGVPLGAPVA